jgi:hypothetical protein
MTEIDDLSLRRGQLLEVISQASNDIKIIDDRLRILRSVSLELDPDEVRFWSNR